jgi:hypothetical protein
MFTLSPLARQMSTKINQPFDSQRICGMMRLSHDSKANARLRCVENLLVDLREFDLSGIVASFVSTSSDSNFT